MLTSAPMRIDQISRRLEELGAKSCHQQRIFRAWLQARPLDSGARRQRGEDFLPLKLREALPQISDELAGLACVRSVHPGQDDSERLLVEWSDGQTVESVLLPRGGC